MERTVTGRISRRGIFVASTGEEAKAAFGKPWHNRVHGHERVHVTVRLSGGDYAAVIPAKADQVTLTRQF